MSGVIKASVALAVLVGAVSLGLALSGYQVNNPIGGQFAFLGLAVLINIVYVVWGLKMTASDSGYLKQLGNGAMIGVVGGLLIFVFSVLLLTVLMPDYLDQVKQSMLEWLETAPLADAQREAQRASVEAATPVSQSFAGFVGTFFTSVIVAAIAGIFLRRKDG